MSRRNLILLILTLIAVTATVAGIILIKRSQDIREKAAPASSLTITPSTQDIPRGSNGIVSVKLNTSTNLVTALDIRLKFDPTKLEVVSFTPGSGIGNLNRPIEEQTGYNNTTGDLSFVTFTTDKTKAITGSNLEVLKVTFKVKSGASLGNQSISFGSNTSVAAVNEAVNVLVNKTGAIIKVIAAPTPTPTPIRTTTPSAVPTKSPTPVSTKSPSPTPVKTSTPSPTPTPRPGDVNGDRFVNIVDIGIMVDYYRVTPVNRACDFNNDGQVDIADVGIVIDNYDL